MARRGRPVKYNPAVCDVVEKLCLVGCTNAQIAEFLEIDRDTLDRWTHKYRELYDTIKNNKIYADGLVAKSLYDKALKGDTLAQIFWLKNRQRIFWRDKHDNDNVDQDGRKIIPKIIIIPASNCQPIAQIASAINTATDETQE